ncbi:tetratricopeptide repeat protein [Winogradskyella sp. MH6]|uniref:tetratricopeptide repeat protein n=1 Tax=Winogradskyella sp. MH6 TaxID=2929510 RepID=UPI001FB47AE8|nr:tetratricopeptide repeat protein [Winogradskyella sp. MH6]
MRFRLLYILSFVLSSTALNAHGDLHKRIQEVTEEIHKNPDSANLYFKRGKLYYQHSNYINSLKDFKSSSKLGLESVEQDFYIAKSNYHLENFSKSIRTIKRILKEDSGNVGALKLLADIYFKKSKYEKAANLYDEAILNSEAALPEDYLYASKAWYAIGTEYGHKRSQSILIEGIEKLGDIIVLYNELISNYIEMQDLDSAVKFQNKVIKISNRKERAYLELANIQIQQEKFEEAKISIDKAEDSYKKLPHRIRNAKFMREFYSELKTKKIELKK